MKIMLPLFYWCVFSVGLGAAAGSGTGSSSTERELNQTPTWAVAGVCTVIILISILLEKSLHKLGTVRAATSFISAFPPNALLPLPPFLF